MVSLMQSAVRNPLPLADIYSEVGIEASTARRLFHRILHQNPRAYYRQLRLQYGREILQSSGFSIARVAEMTGFSDSSAFTRAYRQVYGRTPASERKKLKCLGGLSAQKLYGLVRINSIIIEDNPTLRIDQDNPGRTTGTVVNHGERPPGDGPCIVTLGVDGTPFKNRLNARKHNLRVIFQGTRNFLYSR